MGNASSTTSSIQVLGQRTREAFPLDPHGEPVVFFTVPGEPVAKERPRHGNGNTYTPQKTHEAEGVIGWELKAALKKRSWEPDGTSRYVLLAAFFCAGRPKDLDNMVKTLKDGITKSGAVWADDGQVIRYGDCQILPADERGPRTEVRIYRIPEQR